ncbi:MAG TPA: class I mannose-6-phosphate isomerase [Candidatus Coprenecus stercoravium]|uniref:Class I mannose-6-phosphate isomerase n=1 Tax=Candidatus Coprenecus stercoravium TaxID=2840735 RepID=A0A9D2K9K0_9BACT|nr:class I mannose-6-phosphate isomerase [Candidatus Coprenecus stercoravium]
MKKAIYPLKFVPEPKERVWGGHRLATQFNKPFDPEKVIGESWEISGFEEDSSMIAGGWLDGNPLFDVIETYMDEIVGDDNYKRFGNEFPILVKLLDISDRLSVQVHPDDETAFDRHNSYGKTEAWYVLDADPDARIYMGFNKDMDVREFLDRCAAGTLEEVLNVVTPHKGDFFFIEAGTVHSAGGGLAIAEIQQLSDVTYRIYDWGRENNPATARQMHVDQALSCINYRKYDGSAFVPAGGDAPSKRLVTSKYFIANELNLSAPVRIWPDRYESFILYSCLEGEASLTPSDSKENYTLLRGEWILVPAAMSEFVLAPSVPGTKLMEVYIGKAEEKDDYIKE